MMAFGRSMHIYQRGERKRRMGDYGEWAIGRIGDRANRRHSISSVGATYL